MIHATAYGSVLYSLQTIEKEVISLRELSDGQNEKVGIILQSIIVSIFPKFERFQIVTFSTCRFFFDSSLGLWDMAKFWMNSPSKW
jgi:hypothetical protein